LSISAALRRFIVGFVAASIGGTAVAGAPVDALRAQAPTLFALYQEYSSYQSALGEYANRQGFRAPYENLATIVHEMIHIASAVHRGYYIDGTYYEPYLSRENGSAPAWPALKNKDVYPYVLPDEKGVIYSVYMPSTPNNHLGNVIDEINAHAHVAAFVCENEVDSGAKQVRNLMGHLHLQEAYLRVLRLSRQADYRALVADRESRGAMVSITAKAWDALKRCGVPEAAIPAKELRYLMTLPQSNNR